MHLTSPPESMRAALERDDAPARSWRQRVWDLQHRFAPYLFVSPFVILFAVFMVYPLGRSIILSLYQTAGDTKKFMGLGNYRYLMVDQYFWWAVVNTASLTLVFLLVQIPLALGLAMLVNAKSVRAKSFFRFAFFSTHLVGMVFASVLFMQMLNPRQGLINRGLGGCIWLFKFLISPSSWFGSAPLPAFYTPPIPWLADPVLARVSILLTWLWLSVGWGMIYFLAALQAVDQELYEAADVDGAGPWRKFWAVTVPGIKPVLVFMILIGTIGGFQLFEIPYMLFPLDNGPDLAGVTIVSYLFSTGWQTGDLGVASAIGWMLVILILAVSLLQFRLSFGGREQA
jgi:ABC-type sugar transport system permease subunit